MVVIRKDNKEGYLGRIKRYARLKKLGFAHNQIVETDAQRRDRLKVSKPDPAPDTNKIDKYYPLGLTKIRFGESVRLCMGHKRYLVVLNEDDRFEGFHSGSIKDELPEGWRFAKWD